MNRTRTVLTALPLLSVLALGACSGDDPQPKVAPPSSSAPTSPSTTPASVTDAPAMPAEARGRDAAAAEAFVTFYWDTVNYAQQTGDVSGLRPLSQRCRACDDGIEFVEEVYDSDGHIVGGDGRLTRLRTRFIEHKGRERAVVDCDLTSTRQEIDYPGSAHDVTYPGGRLAFQFLLARTHDGWAVVFMGEQ